MARTNNTLILPSNVADVTGIVGSAVSVYKSLANTLHANAKQDAEGSADDADVKSQLSETVENLPADDSDEK